MTDTPQVTEAMIDKAWADFVNCRSDEYFGNRTKLDKQKAVLRKFAADVLAAARPTVSGDRLRPALVEAWTDFLDANPDDLTSPEDLPDHALVTCDQMIGIVENAIAAMQEEPKP